MKKIKLLSFLAFFMIGGIVSAQSNDTLSAKKLAEKGTKGDIILGNEYKQQQLNVTPQLLKTSDSVITKEPMNTKKKNCRKMKCCKTQ